MSSHPLSLTPSITEPAVLTLIIGALTVLGAIAYAIYYGVLLWRRLSKQAEEISIVRSQVDIVLRQTSALQIESYRLAQHNLQIDAGAQLIAHDDHNAPQGLRALSEPVVALHLEFANHGNRPVDLLACLVAGKIAEPEAMRLEFFSGEHTLGWRSMRGHYALAFMSSPPPLFAGLSTTESLIEAHSQLVRLDPGERERLYRFDEVTNAYELAGRRHLSVLYKIFVAAVTYPVYASSDDLATLHALVSRQHLVRWRSVQFALRTISSRGFRLALEGRQVEYQAARARGEPIPPEPGLSLGEAAMGPAHTRNPLRRLSTPTAWRCFMLHHWDFDQLAGQAPFGAQNSRGDPFGTERAARAAAGEPVPTVEQVSEQAIASGAIRPSESAGLYIAGSYDAELYIAAIRDYYRQHLDLLLRAWDGLNQTIEECSKPDVGFAKLIKQEPWSIRWQALMDEGYLVTCPAGENPENLDPFACERYQLRTRFILSTVAAPHE